MRVIDLYRASCAPRFSAHGAARPTAWALGLALWLLRAHTQAAQVTLAWDPSPSAGVDGYELYYRLQSGTYTATASLDAGPATTATVPGLSSDTYCFAVTAYDLAQGIESVKSEEVCTTLQPSEGPAPTPPSTSSGVEVIVDNQDSATAQTGIWNVSSGADPWEGESLYSATVNAIFSWTPSLPVDGTYQVYAWWTYRSSRSTTVPYQIRHQTGTTTVTVNQNDVALGGRWNLLGTFSFKTGSAGSVTVSGENGNACADAVRFVKQ